MTLNAFIYFVKQESSLLAFRFSSFSSTPETKEWQTETSGYIHIITTNINKMKEGREKKKQCNKHKTDDTAKRDDRKKKRMSK